MNILSNLDQIANLIIRPARYTYKLSDLGNKAFKIDGKTVTRKDFELKNSRNLIIKGSVFSSSPSESIQQILIYLHCNSGCRVQGLTYLKKAIQNNFTYVVFDFAGSGMSDGKYVSLGHFETEDLEHVYNFVRSNVSQKAEITLWGRSMGAVTALSFILKGNHEISMAIFDSPFKSLRELFIQIGKQKTNFPDIILQVAYRYIRPIIKQKADFDIQQVNLKIQDNSIKTPCVFIASKSDSLVPFIQIEELFRSYKGQKQLFFIEQQHNQARNSKVIEDVFESMRNHTTQLGKLKSQFNKRQAKSTKPYFSQLDKKQMSKKKLSLTIKSLSQRQLFTGRKEVVQINDQKKVDQQNQKKKQILTPILQKKPISCLLPHKKSLRLLEQNNQQQDEQQCPTPPKFLMGNKSQSKLRIKRKPLGVKQFFNNNNINYVKEQKSNLSSSSKQNVIKFKNKLLEQNNGQVINRNFKKQEFKDESYSNQQMILRKCDSLERIETNKSDVQVTKGHKKIHNIINEQQANFTTHREVKCTERVLEKIIEKQQKKLLILNVLKKTQSKEKVGCVAKERKTLQHIAKKNPPFVELKGFKQYRNSLQSKYKSEARK